MNDDRLHTRVGAFVILGLIAAVALTLGLEGKHLRPGIRVHVSMDRTGPLVVGAKVKVSGRVIGSIDRIRLLPRPAGAVIEPGDPNAIVMLDVWIDRRYRWLARENSEFFLNQVGILGEAYLEVGPPRGDDGQPVPPGDELPDGATVKGIDPPRLDRLAQVSYENLQVVMDLMRDGLPEARQLGRALDDLGTTLDGLATDETWKSLGVGRARLWLEGGALIDEWRAAGLSPSRIRKVAARTQALVADVRRDLSAIRSRIDPVTANVDAIRARITPERLAKFGQAIDRADALAARAEQILATVQDLAALVERGEGTIGAFLHDDEIADEFKDMTRKLKEQPWETVGHPQ